MVEAWFFQKTGAVRGPVSFARLKTLARHGDIVPDDSVKCGKAGAWALAGSIVGLFSDGFHRVGADSAGIRVEPRVTARQLSDHARRPISKTTAATTPSSSERVNRTQEDEWYCRLFGMEFGPMPFEKFRLLTFHGELSGDDKVKLGQDGEWIAAEVLSKLLPGIASADKVQRKSSGESEILQPISLASEKSTSEARQTTPTTAQRREVDDAFSNSRTRPFVRMRLEKRRPVTANRQMDTERDSSSPDGVAAHLPQWYCRIDGEVYGPVQLEFLRKLAISGKLHSDVGIRIGRDGDWVRFGYIEAHLADSGSGPDAQIDWNQFPHVFQKCIESFGSLNVTAEGKLSIGGARHINLHARSSQLGHVPLSQFSASVCKQLKINWGLAAILVAWVSVNAVVLSIPAESPNGRRPGRSYIAIEFPRDTIDEDFYNTYETYHEIWRNMLDLRARNTTEAEWIGFLQQTKERLVPIFEKLKENDDPAKVFILRMGKWYLLPVIQSQRSGNLSPYVHRHLLDGMQHANRALEDASFEPSSF